MIYLKGEPAAGRIFDSDIYFAGLSDMELLHMDRREKVLGAIHQDYGSIMIRLYGGAWRPGGYMPDLGAYEGIDSVPNIFESGLLRMGERICFYSMEERTGAVPLSKSLREGQRLDADRARNLLRSGLRAVRSLEAAGRVHGHLTSFNMLMDSEGVVRLSEPGIGPVPDRHFRAVPDISALSRIIYESMDRSSRDDPDSGGLVRMLSYLMTLREDAGPGAGELLRRL